MRNDYKKRKLQQVCILESMKLIAIVNAPQNVDLFAAVFLKLRKRRVHDITERRRCLRARRRRDFHRKQRMMFAFLLSMASLTIQSPVRSVPRSNSWWEDAKFTSDDWLENLRMSKATFLYVCDELLSSVETPR